MSDATRDIPAFFYLSFLNDSRINWQRFTMLLSAQIISRFMKPLTNEKRKDVFIVDDNLFDRSRSQKVEMPARVLTTAP